ncbi:MAG TPA: hypothetical protein VE961_14845, partial [Pyrinomonadaceae bacterium]|nr:hypothetical protein [Pyrinomonadaceae bacterium]
MATANVLIKNNSGGKATIILFHRGSSGNTQNGHWVEQAGGIAGPLTIEFDPAWGDRDYWSVMIQLQDGDDAGMYISSGTGYWEYWKECQLEQIDAV